MTLDDIDLAEQEREPFDIREWSYFLWNLKSQHTKIITQFQDSRNTVSIYPGYDSIIENDKDRIILFGVLKKEIVKGFLIGSMELRLYKIKDDWFIVEHSAINWLCDQFWGAKNLLKKLNLLRSDGEPIPFNIK